MSNLSKSIVLVWSLVFNQVSEADITCSYETLENMEITKNQVTNSLNFWKNNRNFDNEYIKNVSEMKERLIKKASINIDSYRFWLSNWWNDLGFWRNNIVIETHFNFSWFNIKGEVGTWKDNNWKSWVFAWIKTNF